MTTYEDFIASKRASLPFAGLAELPGLNPRLDAWQAKAVSWALRLGRAALFEECGLGKTLQQLAWADAIPGRTIILTPLAVAPQTVAEACKFSVRGVAYHRAQADADQAGTRIVVANYEMLDAFDPAAFAAVVLDESSILKNFMGKRKQALMEAFRHTPYRLCCTATPSPNDLMELGNHSDFLGIMPANEMLARWFINDASTTGKYRLKGYAAADFWAWVASWAVSVKTPADLGFDDARYQLPALSLQTRIVGADVRGQAEGELLRTGRLSATELYREMRRTAPDRARSAADLVTEEPNESWLLWCNTNFEADALLEAIPGAREVRGGDSVAQREATVAAFERGEIKVLVTKPGMCGFGLNWQHCARVAFVGLSYSFEQFYQALRRTWRFGQKRVVFAWVILAETETETYRAVIEKGLRHADLNTEMVAASRHAHGVARRESLRLDAPSAERVGRDWRMLHGDCVEAVRQMENASVNFAVFSPPFANYYIYSDSIRDMGNCRDEDEFFRHFDFLLPELLRITRPGRLCAVHCKDLVRYQNRDGQAGMYDFPGVLIQRFELAGWQYHSRVTIWKDPVTEMQRTKAHGLLYRTLKADATFSRQGMPDYLLIFRRWDGDEALATPVRHDPDKFPLAMWQRFASPVWFDIDPTDVLNVKLAREDRDERHICPLQLKVIRRAVELWTNPGDLVFSPFAGIGSEGYASLEKGRRFLGVELKERYWAQACANLARLEAETAEDNSLLQWGAARHSLSV